MGEWSVELFDKKIKNPVLKSIFTAIIVICISSMLIVFSALLIIPHLILRLVGRHGFLKITRRSFNMAVSSEAFKKVES